MEISLCAEIQNIFFCLISNNNIWRVPSVMKVNLYLKAHLHSLIIFLAYLEKKGSNSSFFYFFGESFIFDYVNT